jgi:hypothetical protein
VTDAAPCGRGAGCRGGEEKSERRRAAQHARFIRAPNAHRMPEGFLGFDAVEAFYVALLPALGLARRKPRAGEGYNVIEYSRLELCARRNRPVA